MERNKKHIAFLDTHIVIWLYDALTDRFTKKAIKIINSSDLYISPLVYLEIEYLYEIKKIKVAPSPVIASLSHSINLKTLDSPLQKIIDIAVTLNWTRDPFDRLLVAQAYLNDAYFISKDEDIRSNYPLAVW